MKLTTLLGLVIATACNAAFADQLADLLGDRAYLSRLNWAEVEQSRLLGVPGWRPYEGKQDPGVTFLRKRDVAVSGRSMEALLGETTGPPRHKWITISSSDEKIENCREVVDWATRQFGAPRLVVDATGREDQIAKGNWVEHVDVRTQWDVGSTRVSHACVGVRTAAGEKDKLFPQTVLSHFIMGSAGSEAELKPLFGLRCTRRLEAIGSQPPRDLQDLALIVDENTNRVRWGSKVMILGEHAIDDAVISYSTSTSEANVVTRIDRSTGSLTSTITMKKGGQVGKVMGRCEKTAPGERKF